MLKSCSEIDFIYAYDVPVFMKNQGFKSGIFFGKFLKTKKVLSLIYLNHGETNKSQPTIFFIGQPLDV